MVPHFQYDHVRGCLQVRIEMFAAAEGGRMFMTQDGGSMVVAPGEEPPLYASLPDHQLLGIIMKVKRES